jgi:glucose/arabinose dehydrogenase
MKLKPLAACVLVSLMAGACDASDPIVEPPPNPLRPANTTCFAPERPPSPGAVKLEEVFAAALTPEQRAKLTDLRQHPSDPARWYVAQQSGQVWTFTADATEAVLVIDVAAKMRTDHSEAGLVSLALHPDFADNGQIFLVYSANVPNQRFRSRIERYTVPPGELAADPETAQIILDVPQPAFFHSGNHIVFGPEDGYLYYALGDGGSATETRHLAQSTDSLYGKVLRLDVDATDAERQTPYAIPADNPFRDGEAPEV